MVSGTGRIGSFTVANQATATLEKEQSNYVKGISDWARQPGTHQQQSVPVM